MPWQETRYEYSGTEVQQARYKRLDGGGFQDTTFYEWQGGNMVRWHRRIYGTLIYAYYPDQPWTEGDPLSLPDRFRSTGYIVRTTNLVKSVRSEGASTGTTYTYTFDTAGRMTRWETGAGGASSRHFYTCY